MGWCAKGMVVRVSQVKLGWRGNKISMASKIAEILLYSKHLLCACELGIAAPRVLFIEN